MPTLNVPGGFRNFDVFWCDGGVAGVESQSGLVLLVFDRPLPADCQLAVLGTQDEVKDANCLHLTGLGHANTATTHAVPISAAWTRFDLRIICLGATAEVGRVDLKFDREATTSSNRTSVLSIYLQHDRLFLAAPPNGNPARVAMRLYQRVDPAGVIGPATRLPDTRQPAYSLRTRSPRRSPKAGPSTPRQSATARRSFEVAIIANTREAAGALKDIRLWHASLALLGKSHSTLGIFESPMPSGFRPVEQVFPSRRRLVFAVAGAAPGDFLAITTGLDESQIVLMDGGSGEPPVTSGACAVFEIHRSGELKILQPASLAPTIMPLGQNPGLVSKEIEYQLERIIAKWSGARTEIARLAQTVASGFANQATLAELAAGIASPATFAVALALRGDLIDSCSNPVVAEEIASIVDSRPSGFIERLTSAAVGLAVEREDIRQSLLRQTAGNYDPWLGPDGLRSVFETLFNRPAVHAPARPIEPEDWYERTTDPMARIAILAIATDRRRAPGAGFKIAQRLIGAGLIPDISDKTAPDVDSLLAFCEDQLVDPPADRALSDALIWAAAELGDTSGYDASAEDIRSRLEEIRDNTISHQSRMVALHDLRRWKDAIQFEEIAARLNDIRDILATTPVGLSAIPRFDRDRGPFASGFDEASLRQQLKDIAARYPAWQALARNAAVSSKWPNSARAALLATIKAIGEPQSQGFDLTRQLHPDADEDIENAGILFDPAVAADGLLGVLKEHAEREQANREHELLQQAGSSGEIDADRLDVIRTNARQYAALSATKKLFEDVASLIDDVGKEFGGAKTTVAQARAALRALEGPARQRSAERLDKLIVEFVRLRDGYVNGVEFRLKKLKHEPREKVFDDIPAIEADKQSAISDLQALRKVLSQIAESPSTEES
jgi:hypothetical protein